MKAIPNNREQAMFSAQLFTPLSSFPKTVRGAVKFQQIQRQADHDASPDLPAAHTLDSLRVGQGRQGSCAEEG